MNIPVELLHRFNALKAGKVFYGELARDGSPYAAVVVAIHNGMVHYYCFTSQELTIKRYNQTDPLASVTLSDEEARTVFTCSSKTTYIYCGKSNWGRLPEEEFLKKTFNGSLYT